MLFLAGAGIAAGQGFVETVSRYGWLLFLGGAAVTLVPMCIAFVLATYVFKLSLPDTLGSICGGMTSTPALGALILLQAVKSGVFVCSHLSICSGISRYSKSDFGDGFVTFRD